MQVTRFLERENVIRFFGLALLLSPFVNLALHFSIFKTQNEIPWAQVNFIAYLKSGNPVSYFLAICSLIIGFKMLSGAAKAWRYVLFLIGAHLLLQIINVNNKAWHGPLAWPSFLLNAGLFFFVIDQLVWKIKVVMPDPTSAKTKDGVAPLPFFSQKQVINLKSYRKILFSFGSTKPWGELKTLSSVELSVKSFAEVPANIEKQVVQINFAKDVVVDIQFDRKVNEIYYFKPLNMSKDEVSRLNTWLKKIAI